MNAKLTDYLGELFVVLADQLDADDRRWGNTWLRRPRKNQGWRIFKTYLRYFWRRVIYREPIPWLKIIGNAFIAWMREDGHPELWKE